jgi:hypothetical protein
VLDLHMLEHFSCKQLPACLLMMHCLHAAAAIHNLLGAYWHWHQHMDVHCSIMQFAVLQEPQLHR